MTPVAPIAAAPPTGGKDRALWATSQALEATFLAEMLKNAGVGTPRDALGGGAGEAPFTSFLTTEYARSMSEQGGVGLAEAIYRALAAEGTPT